MANRNIIVIGASSGGFEALKQIVHGLPEDFDASIFVVWHISADVLGILPDILNRHGKIIAHNAVDHEPILTNKIYVAPPDHHLIIEKDQIRITRGPKENRFRPAIDPLFRSAAYTHGKRVIGVILSGGLDDGTAGLSTIKKYGGVAIVQDPQEAEVPSMPENALRSVNVDHCVRVSQLAGLLVKLSQEKPDDNKKSDMNEDKKTRTEIQIALESVPIELKVMDLGQLSPYTCPECHGILTALNEDGRIRYRCHTGHAFSVNSLLATLTENIGSALWNAIRGIEESMILLNHIGDHFAEDNQPKLAAQYFKKANEAEGRMHLVRQAVLEYEQLSSDSIKAETDVRPLE